MATAKPQLRGLLASSMKKHMTITFGLGLSSAMMYHYLVAVPRKQRYADFYKTYDPEAAFKVMRNAGLLQSCGPDE